jgi:hypothetical protein
MRPDNPVKPQKYDPLHDCARARPLFPTWPAIFSRTQRVKANWKLSNKPQQSNWVTAVFQNAAVCIELAHQTTLAQLAEQLGALGGFTAN